jgi:hypothetical protein
LVIEPDGATIFQSIDGGPFHLDRMSKLMRHYVEQANLGKSDVCLCAHVLPKRRSRGV